MVVLHIHSIVIKLVNVFLADVLQFFWRKSLKQVPRFFQAFENSSLIIRSLGDELVFESLEEFKVEKIILTERLFSDNSLHSQSVLAHCIVEVQLVRHLLVIRPGSLFSYSAFHKSA